MGLFQNKKPSGDLRDMEFIKKHPITLCKDGYYRLVFSKKELEDLAKPGEWAYSYKDPKTKQLAFVFIGGMPDPEYVKPRGLV